MRTNGDARRHAGIGGRRAEAWRPFPSRRWGRQPPRSALIQASSPSPELAQVIITMLFLPFSSLLNNNLFFPLTAYVLFFHLIETVKGIRWRLNLSASLSMLMCIEQAPLLSKPSLSKGTQEFFPSKEIFSPSDLSFPSCHHYSAVQIFQLLPHPLLLSKTKFLGNNIYTS